MRLKSSKKQTVGSYLGREIIIIVSGIIISIMAINYYYNRFNSTLLAIEEEMAKKYITKVINEATLGVKYDDELYKVVKNSKDEIILLSYDTYTVTKVTNEITYNIQSKLGDGSYLVIGEIPLGQVFQNGIIKNLGPRIKVGIRIIGNILTELSSEVKPYGINNALIEVDVKVRANIRVVLPIKSEDIGIQNNIPISISVVNGKVPEAYIGGLTK